MIEEFKDMFIDFESAKKLKVIYEKYPELKPVELAWFYTFKNAAGDIKSYFDTFDDNTMDSETILGEEKDDYFYDGRFPTYINQQIMKKLLDQLFIEKLSLYPSYMRCTFKKYYTPRHGEKEWLGDEDFTGKDYAADLLIYLDEQGILEKMKGDSDEQSKTTKL